MNPPASEKTETQTLLDAITLVLVRPRVPENVGAVARVAHNMGIKRLCLVGDTELAWEPMARVATHNSAHLLETMSRFPTLEEALSEHTVVVGTTARQGRHRFVHHRPRDLAEALLPQLANNRVAVVFGPEDTGLSNDELKFCQLTSAIPTDEFSSLNLAQAVAIHCYEFHCAVRQKTQDFQALPAKATTFELESMYRHMEICLAKIDFIDELNRAHWMSNIRNMLARYNMTSKEANLVRGICKKCIYYLEKRSSSKADSS